MFIMVMTKGNQVIDQWADLKPSLLVTRINENERYFQLKRTRSYVDRGIHYFEYEQDIVATIKSL